MIEGQEHTIVISDEQKALSDAAASGRAVLGILNSRDGISQDLSPAKYLTDSLEGITEELLERVVRRHLGYPWIICETDRLVLREFTVADSDFIPKEDTDQEGDQTFYLKEKLEAYIHHQYQFFEYGIWAVVEKRSGSIIGTAGLFFLEEWDRKNRTSICGLQLGYHIFLPCRRKGYAYEACKAVIAYGQDMLEAASLYAKIDTSNEVSIHLAESLGFKNVQTDTAGKRCWNLYEYCYLENP